MKEMAFAAAMKDFFGLHPSQTLSGFMVELKELTVADRAYFEKDLATVGYIVRKTQAT